MVRRKRAGRFLLGIFVLLLVIIGALVWFVYPTHLWICATDPLISRTS